MRKKKRELRKREKALNTRLMYKRTELGARRPYSKGTKKQESKVFNESQV